MSRRRSRATKGRIIRRSFARLNNGCGILSGGRKQLGKVRWWVGWSVIAGWGVGPDIGLEVGEMWSVPFQEGMIKGRAVSKGELDPRRPLMEWVTKWNQQMMSWEE